MAFDFKKEYREFYLPGSKPQIITVPPMNYIAVRGHGDPNEEDGDYKRSIGILYALAYTIKMSKLTDHRIDGYFDYVIPPLEGFWRQKDINSIDYGDKVAFIWTSVIRLPDFVTKADLEWAIDKVETKKRLDCRGAEFLTVNEGICVQIMHIGPFDSEPTTVELMDRYIAENGYKNDFSDDRLHHEIYLSDARKVSPDKWKTVIRHPIAKI